MGRTITILVASDYAPLITLLERATQGEAVVCQVRPMAGDLLKAMAERPYALVVLHERQSDDQWLNLAKALRERGCDTKVIVFGESSDVGNVARGIVHGVANYVLWKFGADTLEIRRVIKNAVAGEDPPKDGVFFRVQSMLPLNQGGLHVLPSGKAFLTNDAIQQCLDLGLTVDETASHLGVGESQVEQVATRKRLKPKAKTKPGAGRVRVLAGVLFAGLGLMILLGRKGDKVFVPVSGTLTISGKPLPDVIVNFSRQGGSHLASGKTDAMGRYRLSTLRPGDGAEEGVHVVWVGVTPKIREHIEMTDPQYTEKMVALMQKIEEEQKTKAKDDDEVVPSLYRDMRSSPLRAEVKGRSPQVLNFDLAK